MYLGVGVTGGSRGAHCTAQSEAACDRERIQLAAKDNSESHLLFFFYLPLFFVAQVMPCWFRTLCIVHHVFELCIIIMLYVYLGHASREVEAGLLFTSH